MPKKTIMMDGFSQTDAVKIMRLVKSAVEDGEDTVFAMVTETAKDWKVKDYLKHLAEEDEEMKKPREKAQK